MEEQIFVPREPQVVETKTERFYKKPKIVGLFALILALAIGAGSLAFVANEGRRNADGEKTGETQNKFLADRSIIYGYWTSESSIIESTDLSTGITSTLSVLPSNIKHINIPFPNLLYYIAETNLSDYGTKIIQKNIAESFDKEIISADSGFGIDDYRISPNGNFIAVWMVELSPDATQLLGGKSRVYTVDVNTNSKNLIYDEVFGPQTSVNYPIGITNSGQIFTDKFLSNSGAGWAYGMSVSNVDGSTKTEIDSMDNGTYGSQPVMGDGESMAFAGYSGTDGLTQEDGFRKALVNADTFEIFDITTMTRKKIDTGLDSAIYSGISWDGINKKYFVSAIHKDSTGSVVTSQYTYSPVTQTLSKLEIPSPTVTASNLVLGTLEDGSYLVANKLNEQSSMGNLGKAYSQQMNMLNIFDPSSTEMTRINISQEPFQLIDIKMGDYFTGLIENGSLNTSSKQLQLQTFVFKPTLAPVRERQQSERPVPVNPPPVDSPTVPECREIGYPQCNNLLGKDYPVDKDIGDIGDDAFSECIWAKQAAGEASGTCMDSPLYLYGTKGKNVTVGIGASISNPNIEIQNNQFNAELDGKGNISVENSIVPSIEFDYVSRVNKIEAPEQGYLVKNLVLEDKLVEISNKFTFNEKETLDLINFAKGINSPYVYVSFFDDKTSRQILPLYFHPEPDIYRNIVFYFEKRNSSEKIPQEPLILPISRKGFTAIEISYILR